MICRLVCIYKFHHFTAATGMRTLHSRLADWLLQHSLPIYQ